MKVKAIFGLLRCYSLLRRGCHTARPFPSVRFAVEHVRYDPKDGELYLSRMKPGETLVEVRSDTDVQIVRQTWV